MTHKDKELQDNKARLKAEKEERLSEALRTNLRRRKSRQREAGDAPPSAIKNTNRLTD